MTVAKGEAAMDGVEATPVGLPSTPSTRQSRGDRAISTGRQDWSAWPSYEAASVGYRDYWYPTVWSNQVAKQFVPITLLGEQIVLARHEGKVHALHDRCPHRGVPLSLGTREFPGHVSCPYHGWTFDLETGTLKAVITDGPDSPICGKVAVRTYPTAERLGLVWVYVGDGDPPPIERELPAELNEHRFTMGGKVDVRSGNWRHAAENGFDEGHAKFLHRTSWWRMFKVMPTWNKTRIVEDGPWLTRVQDEVYWEADFPGLGRWTNKRWWKRMPLPHRPDLSDKANPTIQSLQLQGFASLRLPGMLRIAYPRFIHYEWYVPVDADYHRYVQVLVAFERGPKAVRFLAGYLGAVRWLFHGQFTAQDAWMVDVMDCPPERLYRPDVSILSWRRMCEARGGTPQPNGTPPPPSTTAPAPDRTA